MAMKPSILYAKLKSMENEVTWYQLHLRVMLNNVRIMLRSWEFNYLGENKSSGFKVKTKCHL